MDVLDFTSNHEEAKLKILACRAFGGGGDGPEDIAGALERGL